MENENADSPTVITRRGFLKLAVGVITAVGAAVLAIPLVGSLVGPSMQKMERHFARVADLAAIPIDQPTSINYSDQTTEAYIRETTTRNVWVIKHSPSEVTVYSPICPHLGCRYNLDQQSQQFVCPCHGSVFALDGQVLAGPSPRPLDTLGQTALAWH